jgi:hypothetical protein
VLGGRGKDSCCEFKAHAKFCKGVPHGFQEVYPHCGAYGMDQSALVVQCLLAPTVHQHLQGTTVWQLVPHFGAIPVQCRLVSSGGHLPLCIRASAGWGVGCSSCGAAWEGVADAFKPACKYSRDTRTQLTVLLQYQF